MATSRKTPAPATDASLDDWAAKPSTRRGRSTTERDHADLIPDIERFLELRAEGKSSRSLAQFRDQWLEPRGYKPTVGCLREFCIARFPELYRRAVSDSEPSS